VGGGGGGGGGGAEEVFQWACGKGRGRGEELVDHSKGPESYRAD
jgi:hypothetical protein